MSALAPTLEAFLADRLMIQRGASPNTIASYRDTFRLLLRFAAGQTAKRPSDLDFSDLDARLIGAFLEHLEVVRHNSVRTRNNRLAAIHSPFATRRFVIPSTPPPSTGSSPSPSSSSRATSSPTWTTPRSTPSSALVTSAPGRGDATRRCSTSPSRRACASELAALTCGDVTLGIGANLHVVGKGRKERRVPLGRKTVGVMRAWLAERGVDPAGPLFPTTTGRHMSRDAIERRVTLHVERAATGCPSLQRKQVSAHTLRHTCAMRLHSKGVALEIIALILGHKQVSTTYGFYLNSRELHQTGAFALVAW
jgi:site-specific recombinase XerD